MAYLYAGLGMTMLAAIVTMFEMSNGLTRQQMAFTPPVDSYSIEFQAADQAIIKLLLSEDPNVLKGFFGSSSQRCSQLNQLIINKSNLYPTLNGYHFDVSLSNSLRLVDGCLAVDSSGLHRIYAVPTNALATPFSILSCVLRRDKQLWEDRCSFEEV